MAKKKQPPGSPFESVFLDYDMAAAEIAARVLQVTNNRRSILSGVKAGRRGVLELVFTVAYEQAEDTGQ